MAPFYDIDGTYVVEERRRVGEGVKLHVIFLPWCPRPAPWRDALGHHRWYGVWYYFWIFELSTASAAATAGNDDDKAVNVPDNVPLVVVDV